MAGSGTNNRIISFKRANIEGPNFICYSCRRCLFRISVLILNSNRISSLLEKLDKDLAIETGMSCIQNMSEVVICPNCYNKLKRNVFPNLNIHNGLMLDEIPLELLCLTDLEQQMIALSLIFMKIKKLPTSRMRSLVDRVISVPIESSDVTNTVSKLPRRPGESEIVAVKLKKKLEFKSSYLEEYVRPKALISAVNKLKSLGNPYYQNIKVDHDFMKKIKNIVLLYQMIILLKHYYFIICIYDVSLENIERSFLISSMINRNIF